MTGDAWLLLAWVGTSALFAVAQVQLAWDGFRDRNLAWTWRLWALVPPATLWVAWRKGLRAWPSVWIASGGLYLVLRALG